MSSKKMITLKSLDGETFQVEEAVAKISLTIKHMIEDGDDDDMVEDEGVHLRKVTKKVLSRVIEYSKKHVADEKEEEEELKAWDQDFVAKTDKSTLCNLLLAANYLKIQSLLVLLSKNAFHKTEADDMRAILKGF